MARQLGVNVDISYHGPIFDIRARRAFRNMKEDLEREAAEWAENQVKQNFHTSFREPTGRYEETVRAEKLPTGWDVWDGGEGGFVYGPWLEGVGSRNRTTRFKGYWSFKRAAAALEHHIDEIGDRLFRTRYRRRLE